MDEISGFGSPETPKRPPPMAHPWTLHHPSARRVRHDNGNGTPCVCAITSENRKNTEFRTILDMGLREAYPKRAIAVLAYGALEDTHTEHPADLGPKRRWSNIETAWSRGPVTF